MALAAGDLAVVEIGGAAQAIRDDVIVLGPADDLCVADFALAIGPQEGCSAHLGGELGSHVMSSMFLHRHPPFMPFRSHSPLICSTPNSQSGTWGSSRMALMREMGPVFLQRKRSSVMRSSLSITALNVPRSEILSTVAGIETCMI